jgi:hypothetical protein
VRRLDDTGGSTDTDVDTIPLSDLVPRVLPRRVEEFTRSRSWWRLRVSVSATVLCVLAAVLVVRDVQSVRAAEAAAIARYQRLTREVQEAVDASSRIEELMAARDALAAGTAPDVETAPYDVLAALASIAGENVVVEHITVRGVAVELSGVGSAPLSFANRLASEGPFVDVSLRRVQPLADGGQRFSLTGTYRP